MTSIVKWYISCQIDYITVAKSNLVCISARSHLSVHLSIISQCFLFSVPLFLTGCEFSSRMNWNTWENKHYRSDLEYPIKHVSLDLFNTGSDTKNVMTNCQQLLHFNHIFICWHLACVLHLRFLPWSFIFMAWRSGPWKWLSMAHTYHDRLMVPKRERKNSIKHMVLLDSPYGSLYVNSQSGNFLWW